MAFVRQYQAHAEPVSQSGERILLDKWNPSYPTQFYKSAFVAAVFATSLFFVPTTTQAEVVTVDKWYDPIVQPQFRPGTAHLSQPFANECFCSAVSNEQSKYAWRPDVPDIHLKGKNFNWLYPTFANDEFQSALNNEQQKYDWRPQIPDIVFKKSDNRWTDPWFTIDSKFFVVPNPETVTVDKWFTPIVQPLYSVPRAPWFNPYTVDPKLLTQHESILLDKWEQLVSQPYFDLKRNQFEFPSAFFVSIPSENITVDKWFVQASEPVRVKPPSRLQGYAEPPSVSVLEREKQFYEWRPNFYDNPVLPFNRRWLYPPFTVDANFSHVPIPVITVPQKTKHLILAFVQTKTEFFQFAQTITREESL